MTNYQDRYSRHPGTVNTSHGQLTIRVAPSNIGRALRFMNTMIKLLRVRNHDIIAEGSGTYAVIGNERIKISLKEKLQFEHNNDGLLPTWEYGPTGILTFRIEELIHNKEWKDGKLKLEDQLSRILAKLELEAKRKKEERIYYETQRKKTEIRFQAEKELKEREEKERIDFEDLLE